MITQTDHNLFNTHLTNVTIKKINMRLTISKLIFHMDTHSYVMHSQIMYQPLLCIILVEKNDLII